VAGRPVYLIGIGGCGMAGMARMLAARGAIVTGSDLTQSETTEALATEGIRIGFDQSKQWLPGPEEGGAGVHDSRVAPWNRLPAPTQWPWRGGLRRQPAA